MMQSGTASAAKNGGVSSSENAEEQDGPEGTKQEKGKQAPPPLVIDPGTGGSLTGDSPRRRVRLKIVGGDAVVPLWASPKIKAMVAAANKINEFPYSYGAAHGDDFFNGPRAFDCSSAISYVIYAAGLLKGPLDSSSFMKWGKPGKGINMTVYTNPGHAFMVIGDKRFDTGRGGTTFGRSGSGPRWGLSRPTGSYVARHIEGL